MDTIYFHHSNYLSNKRKQEITKETAKESKELEILNRSQKLELQTKENLTRKQEEYKERLNQLTERREQLQTRLEKIDELVKSSVQKKSDLKRQQEESQQAIVKAGKRKDELVGQIDKIQAELRERKADMLESKRDQQMKELINNLSRLFPTVRGRLIDLVEPREHYALAVTVTLGKNMDAIIVDDEKTAIECLNVSFFPFAHPFPTRTTH